MVRLSSLSKVEAEKITFSYSVTNWRNDEQTDNFNYWLASLQKNDSLLPYIHRVHVKTLVTKLVEALKGDPEVGGLQQVLHLLAVCVEAGRVDVDAWGQHTINYLKRKLSSY